MDVFDGLNMLCLFAFLFLKGKKLQASGEPLVCVGKAPKGPVGLGSDCSQP